MFRASDNSPAVESTISCPTSSPQAKVGSFQSSRGSKSSSEYEYVSVSVQQESNPVCSELVQRDLLDVEFVGGKVVGSLYQFQPYLHAGLSLFVYHMIPRSTIIRPVAVMAKNVHPKPCS